MTSEPKSEPPADFGVAILTHGRADFVYTYASLIAGGYTGPIVFVVDSDDEQIPAYQEKFGEENVAIFNKRDYDSRFDIMDNFSGDSAIVWARHAVYDIMAARGLRYFIQLDDDYNSIMWRFGSRLDYVVRSPRIRDLNRVFGILLDGYIEMGFQMLAMAQGGDFIGGAGSPTARAPKLLPKCMNSFICDVEKPVRFNGRYNEDVTTYTTLASRGQIFRTSNHCSVNQKASQGTPGGMTESYLNDGTYIKTWYSVMAMPSAVSCQLMPHTTHRIHHAVAWNEAVPKILHERHRRAE